MKTKSVSIVGVDVDAKGLNCPLSILKARKALMNMELGQVLKAIAPDPTSVDDFPVFAKATKNILLEPKSIGNEFFYFLRVGE